MGGLDVEGGYHALAGLYGLSRHRDELGAELCWYQVVVDDLTACHRVKESQCEDLL